MHKVFLSIFIAGTLIVSAAQPPDFTGRWECVIAKSSFGNGAKPTRMTVESTVQNGVMHAVQTSYTGQEEQTAEFDWYLDGKRHDTDKPAPGYSITHWEGKTLINERQSNDGVYKQMTRVTLSADGQTATEEIQTKNPNGSNREKLVWQKLPK
jgi:hypothetical protein